MVLVDGEPGIGRSLLLRHATDAAADQGFSLAAGAADPLGQVIPFFALRAALREPFAGLTADDPGRDLPDATAWRIIQLRAHLEQRAAAGPVLVCLDDLHWASPVTLAALRALQQDTKRNPVAWLLARSSTPHRATGYLFGQLEKDGAARVTLTSLDLDAVAAMLADAFGAPPDQALADLARGAAGNPSLVAELIGGLRDDHAVQVIGGRAVLTSARLPERMYRLGQRRLDGLSQQARHLLGTAAVLGPAFRLEDVAEMLGQTPATLLPAVQEAMDAAIMTVSEHASAFRHQLLRRAVDEMIPGPARNALHRQYGEILLARGESAAQAASHLLQAAHPGDPASLAGLDQAAAQTLCSAPRIAADLALRALELTPPADPDALSRAVAAAAALTAAGRLDQAARITHDLLAQPLPPAAEDRVRCALSSVLCAGGQTSDARAEAEKVLARPQLPGDVRDQARAAHLQALAGCWPSATAAIARTCRSRTLPAARPGWRSATTASRSNPSTAARRACSCRTCTSGRARNGCGAWNCSTTTSQVSGRPTATTSTETHGGNNGTRATDLAGRHRNVRDEGDGFGPHDRLEVPDWPGHRAGQHLDVRLTAEDGYTAERSYSIATADGEPVAIMVRRRSNVRDLRRGRPGRRDGRLPTRTEDSGPLPPHLLRHAHGHLADPGHELYRPRRPDRTRPPPGRLTTAGNALVRSARPILRRPDASATRTPGSHAGPGTPRR